MRDDSATAEQQAAQAEALENGTLLALARRASRAGTWDLDIRKGEVVYCPRSLEILGHPPDRAPVLTAAEWAEHIYPGDAERVIEEGRRARDNGADLITEYRIVRPDGEIGWVRGVGRTLVDAAGEAVRCVGFNFDITEEKAAEESYRAMQAELVAATRMNAMATMAEALAHRLNQPLTTARNYLAGARRLSDRQGQDDALREALDGAAAAIDGAAEAVRSLRALVRRHNGRPRETELGSAVRRALDLALAGADERNVETTVDLAPGLTIVADSLQVQQVVICLVRNALEAMAGRARRRLAVSGRRDRDRALIRIEDSGAGICPSQRDCLYEPFTTSKPGAMGIGLALSRTIVEAHGGALWAEPLEAGTAFCFTLPLSQPQSGRLAAAPDQGANITPPPSAPTAGICTDPAIEPFVA